MSIINTNLYIGLTEVEAWPEKSASGAAGYQVSTPDNYLEWSPKEYFERIHCRIEYPDNLHPSVQELLSFFKYSHLPPHLQRISRPFCMVAQIVASGKQCAETTVALRKLLEAKDCAVRAAI